MQPAVYLMSKQDARLANFVVAHSLLPLLSRARAELAKVNKKGKENDNATR